MGKEKSMEREVDDNKIMSIKKRKKRRIHNEKKKEEKSRT